jgi:uncharacterized Zn finger protein (UPF0148 family)
MKRCPRCGGPMLPDGGEMACLWCGERSGGSIAGVFLEALASAIERQSKREAARDLAVARKALA